MQKNIDLNLYTVFMKVYELKNISQASNALYVSQPSISYSIKELENQLGVKLFYRKPKGVEPTLEAEKLYYYISNALNIIHIGESKLNEKNDEEKILRIGVPTHICICFLSKYIKSFNELHNNIKFEFIDLSTNSMISLLESKKIDLIIDSLPIKSNRLALEIINLKNLETCFLGSKKIIEKENIKLKDIQNLPFIIPNDNATITKQLNEYLLEYKIKIKSKINIWTTEMMKEFVIKEMGVGFFIKDTVRDLIELKEFVCLDFNNSLPKINVCLAYIPEFQSSISKLFINYMIENKEGEE